MIPEDIDPGTLVNTYIARVAELQHQVVLLNLRLEALLKEKDEKGE